MRHLLVFCLAAGSCLFAQVRFTPDREIDVDIDGKPFTTFHYGADANKPYFSPLRSASGKIVTRLFPMLTVEGESRDHYHHRGLWIGYKEVNGVNFWENDPSYTERGPSGHVVVRKADYKPGDKTGVFTATMDWIAPTGKTLMVEDHTMVFHSDPKLRIIDITATFTASTDIDFGDSHDGLLGIRLAEPFTERKGGLMTNAEGLTKMIQAWGKKSAWVDYTGVVEGERLGVGVFDNPTNPNYPNRWHVRDYGLFCANPLASQGLDDNLPEKHTKLPAGQKLTYKWRVVIHAGDWKSADIPAMYKEYAGKAEGSK